MEAQYYVPTIDEFSFVFDFEILNTKGKFFLPHIEEGLWSKANISYGILSDLSNIHKLILDKQIRVKHLDRQDIEECGWGFSDTQIIDHEVYDIYDLKSDFYGTSLVQNGKNTMIKSHDVLFSGTLRNKSELRKIMQQCGISA